MSSIESQTYADNLTERERQMAVRILADPFVFPLEFKAWLRAFVEESNPALITLQGAGAGIVGDFNAHLADPSDAHDASAISFAPYLTLASTTVQAAIQELLDETTASQDVMMEESVALHG